MDRTVKLLLDKVTQLTNRFNSITQNSKKIHELNNASTSSTLYIAVSDGVNIGKVIYKPSEVTKEEFENLAELQLTNPQNTSLIQIKDSEGNVITSLDLSFLNGNNVRLNIDQTTNSLQLLSFDDEVLSSIEIDDLKLSNQKAVFSHTLTSGDVAQATITLNLSHEPDINDFYDLHINGVYVNDEDYMVQQNKIIIAKSNIAYEVQVGMKLTFRYRY